MGNNLSHEEQKFLKTKARKLLLKMEKEWGTKNLSRHQIEELMITFLIRYSDPLEQPENKSTISV